MHAPMHRPRCQQGWRSRQGVPGTVPRILLRGRALRMYRKPYLPCWQSAQTDQCGCVAIRHGLICASSRRLGTPGLFGSIGREAPSHAS